MMIRYIRRYEMKNLILISKSFSGMAIILLSSLGFSETFEGVVLKPALKTAGEAIFEAPIPCKIGSGLFSTVGIAKDMQEAEDPQIDFFHLAHALDGILVTVKGSLSEDMDCSYSMQVEKLSLSSGK